MARGTVSGRSKNSWPAGYLPPPYPFHESGVNSFELTLFSRTSLAYVEMRVVLARLIWNFDLKLAKQGEDWIGEQQNFILWSKLPLNVVLTRAEKVEG